MNKFLLTLGVVTLGLCLMLGLEHRAALAAEAARRAHQAWVTQGQLLAQARTERAALSSRIQERREELSPLRADASASSAELWFLCTNGARLSPAQSEQSLAGLGFSWRQQPDYVVVNKANLNKISMTGLKGRKVTEAAAQVLALTPEERAALDATAGELNAEYQAWAKANVRREEPSGDVLAKYSLSPDAAFSQSLSNRFVQSVAGTLDPERSELLQSYAYEWMQGLGMFGGKTTTLTIKRYGDSQSQAPHLNMQLEQNGGTMSCDVSPYQPFPEAFLPVFPGGWPDLAQREGFELPKEFRQR